MHGQSFEYYHIITSQPAVNVFILACLGWLLPLLAPYVDVSRVFSRSSSGGANSDKPHVTSRIGEVLFWAVSLEVQGSSDRASSMFK